MKVLKMFFPIALMTATFNKRKVYVTSFATVLSVLAFPSASAQSSDDKDTLDSLGNNKYKKTKTSSHRNLEDLVPDNMKSSTSDLKALFESGIPHQIGYGFMMGYSSGFCLKKVSKIAAFALGGMFILVQTLSYNGYINVHYSRLQEDIENLLDLNKDGKFDEHDVQYGLLKANEVLKYQMPAGGGFTTGLLLGLRG